MTSPKRPDLTVGISTTYTRVSRALTSILAPSPGVEYLMVIQAPGDWEFPQELSDIANRPDVRVSIQSATGVANSRNAVIAEARGHIIWFADDDLHYDTSLFQRIITAMNKHPDCQAITFPSHNADGRPRKRFPSKFEYLTLFSAGKYATFEIAVRTDSLRQSEVRFDARFGAGAEYPFGDEYIFLADLLHLGGQIGHVPMTGACHPDVSSAFRDFSNRSETERRVFTRVFGRWIGLLVYPAFKLRKLIRKTQSALRAPHK
ncbi:glycosyltransferase family 2 protein [Aliiroseovarius sp. KMU-50]|uniref:Glycosyltransferase family 2 protein n=2 Tax=Aliiroseovarius salicola TaxID=3009082 RepID=A0ABT4W696_9RHOB|nr:glycosyltransferase family 2 protein [Aliiroseovarius sp. KMU-50]MDA5095387.1 glycosyltransferase family 2 protein [Aliiroseovarius sp. KMU-50]